MVLLFSLEQNLECVLSYQWKVSPENPNWNKIEWKFLMSRDGNISKKEGLLKGRGLKWKAGVKKCCQLWTRSRWNRKGYYRKSTVMPSLQRMTSNTEIRRAPKWSTYLGYNVLWRGYCLVFFSSKKTHTPTYLHEHTYSHTITITHRQNYSHTDTDRNRHTHIHSHTQTHTHSHRLR